MYNNEQRLKNQRINHEIGSKWFENALTQIQKAKKK